MSGSSLADGHGHSEDSVGPEAVLVVGTVQLQHHLVNLLLLHRVHAILHQLGRNDVVHIVNCLHTFIY